MRVLDPVRQIHPRSDFVRRLQDYTGNFETVEYPPRRPLTCSIAQQHRNKVQPQAARIPSDQIIIDREETGLTLLIEIHW